MPEFVQISKTRKRLTFGRARNIVEMPDMIQVQRDSYEWFYQDNVEPDKRKSQGLQELLEEVFPIESYDGQYALEFVKYNVMPPEEWDEKYARTEKDARQLDVTWHRPIRATIRLKKMSPDKQSFELKDDKEIFLGDFPIMTDRGTFIINGTERVVINQLARSAGVTFTRTPDGCSAKLIPDRGAWLDFAVADGEIVSVNFDNRKKLPVTLLLKALGAKDNREIMSLLKCEPVFMEFSEEMKGMLSAEDIYDDEGHTLVLAGRMVTPEIFDSVSKALEDSRDGIKVYAIDASLALTLERDQTKSPDEAMQEIFRKLRPNDPPRVENAREYFKSILTDTRRYTLGRVGRYKLNRRLDMNIPEENRSLTIDDVVAIIKELFSMRDNDKESDNIDHLGNRRVRSIGELLQNQVRIGLLRMERIARERMTTLNLDEVTARELINVRPIVACLREFFGSGQLSQFMDQTNPLAEVTHRRRLSALGPGGLSRERAGFEARDVHYTHYGKICPIETPEGPNIGLVSSLTTYASLNSHGFLVTPRRRVINGKLTNEIELLSADDEDKYYVAMANTKLEADGITIAGEYCPTRHDISVVPVQEVDFMDVSPRQIVSPSTALIPFLEHDDANRALMGSNMQRQAVPLVVSEAPLVGTGIEHKIARDSGSCVIANNDGEVTYVDSNTIKIKTSKKGKGATESYDLIKFRRSNQSTVIHQKPLVRKGDIVKQGDIIADGQAIENGELALGHNVLVAFVPWEGYNFEDAILLSENLIKNDKFTSIHIEEYEIDERKTKLGNEEITRDIPNVGEDMLKDLTESGIIRIGAEVKAGDILVGKVTPKGESDQTPEEKLLRAIFGEKAREVRDNSLKLPNGSWGKVVEVKETDRHENEALASSGVLRSIKVYVAQRRKITVGDKMAGRHGNKGVVSRILPVEDMPYLPDGTPVDIVLNPLGVPSRMNLGQVLETIMGLVAMNNGWHVSTPVFEGANEEEIFAGIRKIAAEKYPELTEDGMITLRDGRTGRPMDKKVTIGCMYMLKLNHLVDDKIHARSTGPYSLITQQPLGGKAQFGGQRFGEMEVWALEGYGAANVLQEILTVKSDDIRGRDKTYERIVKGQSLVKPGVPESFRVLVKELQGLGLDVEVEYDDGTRGDIPLEDEEKGPYSGMKAREIFGEPVRKKRKSKNAKGDEETKDLTTIFDDAVTQPDKNDELEKLEGDSLDNLEFPADFNPDSPENEPDFSKLEVDE